MYLTKISLNLYNPSVRQSLRDVQDLHRNIQKYFYQERGSLNVLFRLYKSSKGFYIYMQSDIQPSESEETLRNGMQVEGSRDVSDLLDRIEKGSRYRFDLIACPTVKKPDRSQKNSKRKFLKTPEEQEAWIQRKGSASGFQVNSVQIQKEEDLYSFGKNFGFSYVHYFGVLTVTAVEKFQNAIVKGIGSEKAYGMGLLFIR